ncbi:NNP family nitrate/nitrite transporter-like MFS transporter [Herbihabitans rhizosphaerae]|uniref:NNP family nitrate/nitrite transporter-like MFS transporter n=1 Tax=Herbihabitans rhizosphaerae TaxID=1872711 RepID=A0A4Q7KI94_9PSEU|nr:MFS transporter [Herbihabitans rhizosphaerae]RZS34899.1 NNP family nitrate/nitrite transporter-like MFS transporter [Herbihabitans rhizosphaerae]
MSLAVAEEQPTVHKGRRWIEHWDPEDEQFWETTGKKVARRNLAFSIFAEHLGFAVWVLWSVVVLSLPAAGLPMSVSESFWLVSLPNLVGAAMRIPYTFAVPKFGGRLWTTISASLLLIPVSLLAFLVPSDWMHSQSHDTQFWLLLGCAAVAGFGGGNFSSSMANISFFYPEKRKGFALGLNAAGGNLGVAVVQIVVPLVVIIGVPKALVGKEVHLAYAGLMWMPFIVIAAVCAWLFMDSISEAKADTRSYVKALKHGQTWVMSVLYIGTFGSFIGFSFALPLVIKTTFPEFLAQNTFIRDYLAGLGFVGALVGSVSRPFGGWLSDRIGGAKVTLWVFVGMVAATGMAAFGVTERSFALFFGSYMVVFALSGIGNGSTYRMIPVIFGALGRKEASEKGLDPSATAVAFKRQAAAVIGVAGAIGAFGGFLVQQAFRVASTDAATALKGKTGAEAARIAEDYASWSLPALWVFIGSYVVFAGITWWVYLRKSLLVQRAPSLAYAGV